MLNSKASLSIPITSPSKESASEEFKLSIRFKSTFLIIIRTIEVNTNKIINDNITSRSLRQGTFTIFLPQKMKRKK